MDVSALTCLLTALLIATLKQICAGPHAKRASRSINADPQFVRWPGTQIPYYLDASYSKDQADKIRGAMKKVSIDLLTCIQFVEVSPTSPRFKIHVTSKKEDKVTKEKNCYAYPGIYTKFQSAGRKEQRLVLTDGPEGCFDGGQHSLMKYLSIILGKINEHQRPDRDQFIKLNLANLRPNTETSYNRHEAALTVSVCAYDYCSITHNQQHDFAKTGTDAFIVKKPPLYIPKLNQLSECDCKELRALYDCDPFKCPKMICTDPDGMGAVSPDS